MGNAEYMGENENDVTFLRAPQRARRHGIGNVPHW